MISQGQFTPIAVIPEGRAARVEAELRRASHRAAALGQPPAPAICTTDPHRPPMLSRRFLVLALLACLGTLGCRGTERPDVTFVGMCMGTSWKVTVVRDGGFDEAEVPQLRAAVEAELDGVDASMSTWRPDSELSRFNRA